MIAILALACASTPAVPAHPITGAPVAIVVDKLTAPKTIGFQAWNFGSTDASSYSFQVRFLDASGKPLPTRNTDQFQVSGSMYVVKPGVWTAFTEDSYEPFPADAASAEVQVNSVSADGGATAKWTLDQGAWNLDDNRWVLGPK